MDGDTRVETRSMMHDLQCGVPGGQKENKHILVRARALHIYREASDESKTNGRMATQVPKHHQSISSKELSVQRLLGPFVFTSPNTPQSTITLGLAECA